MRSLILVLVVALTGHRTLSETVNRGQSNNRGDNDDAVDDANRKLVCYFTNWSQYRSGTGRFTAHDIDPFLCTHIVVAFAKIDAGGELSVTEENDLETFQILSSLKSSNPNLKVLIAVGGWNAGSDPFKNMVRTRSSRRRFIASALRFIREYGLDGLDYDWEYPANRGSLPIDKMRFTFLLKETRRAFGDSLLLAAAVGVGQQVAQSAYDVRPISRHVDWISLMSYDLHNGYLSTRHHAPLASMQENDTDTLNLEWVVSYWVSHGCPREKLVLGIAAYGRTFTLSNPSLNFVGAPSLGPGHAGNYTAEAGILAYYEICANDWEHELIEEQHVPYKHSGNQWVGYDDPSSVTEKVRFAVDQNLGGAMFWALDLDDFSGEACGNGNYPLVNAARRVLTRYRRTNETDGDTTTTPTTTVGARSTTSETFPTTSAVTSRTTTSAGGRCEFTCPQNFGYYPDPCDCHWFYQCSWSIAHRTMCPARTAWDVAATTCNHEYLVTC